MNRPCFHTLYRHRRGFTVIELLVAITVIGILLGLILPAVQASRELAKRLNCSSNLRQIGLAMQGYSDLHGCLPMGRFKSYDPRYMGKSPPCSSPSYDASYLSSLLPGLEQNALYNSINHSLIIYGLENRTSVRIAVSNFACPSDSDAGRSRPIDTEQLQRHGLADADEVVEAVFTSYVACFGSVVVEGQPWPFTDCRVASGVWPQEDGIVNDLSPMRFAMITDGMSNTMLISERSTSLLRREGSVIFKRYGQAHVGQIGDTLFTATDRPNPQDRSLPAVDRASSQHVGGVNVLMGDGSVRFMANSIDSWPVDPETGDPLGARYTRFGYWDRLPEKSVWQRLATRSGGEIMEL